MDDRDIQIQRLYEALKAAAYYIDRLEKVQRRRVVRDMTEAMEGWNNEGPALIAAHEQNGQSRANDPGG